MWFWRRRLCHRQRREWRFGWWRQWTEQRNDGEGNDFQIQPDGVMPSIIAIYFELRRQQRRLVIPFWVAAIQQPFLVPEIDLRQPGDTRAHAQNVSLFGRIRC